MEKSLDELRLEIDRIDRQMVELFRRRMEAVTQVAEYKQERGLPVRDPIREQALLDKVAQQAGEELSDHIQSVYRTMMAASRSYEHGRMGHSSTVFEAIRRAVETTPEDFPHGPKVACLENGAICGQLFQTPDVCLFQTADQVLAAVERGECRYGILPVEQTGELLALLGEYRCYIVRSAREGAEKAPFLCISKQPEIYPGADRTALMMILSPASGAMSDVLARFFTLGLNLRTWESRPLPGQEWAFLICVEIEGPVGAPEMEVFLRDLEPEVECLRYLGSYSEVIC